MFELAFISEYIKLLSLTLIRPGGGSVTLVDISYSILMVRYKVDKNNFNCPLVRFNWY